MADDSLRLQPFLPFPVCKKIPIIGKRLAIQANLYYTLNHLLPSQGLTR